MPVMKSSLAGILLLAGALSACTTSTPSTATTHDQPFNVVEATIPDMQKAMQENLSLIHISEPTRPY